MTQPGAPYYAPLPQPHVPDIWPSTPPQPQAAQVWPAHGRCGGAVRALRAGRPDAVSTPTDGPLVAPSAQAPQLGFPPPNPVGAFLALAVAVVVVEV